MRLRTRLVLNIAGASLLPLVLLGFGAVRISSDILLGQVSEMQAVTARSLATEVDTWVELQFVQLERQLQTFDVAGLDGESLTSFPRLVYQQTGGAGIVSLTNRQGIDVVPSAYLVRPPTSSERGLAGRAVVDEARFRRFRLALPIAGLGPVSGSSVASGRSGVEPSRGPSLGPSYRPAEGQAPVLPVAFAVPGSDRVLGVELSLAVVEDRLLAQAEEGVQVAVLDEAGALVLGGDQGWVDARAFLPFLGQTAAEAVRYEVPEPDGSGAVEIIAACSPVPMVGWTVVVAEPVATATAPVQDIWARVAYVLGVSVVLSMVLGVLFARSLARPMVELTAAALAVADGELGRTVPNDGEGEVAELGRAFNRMSLGLAQNADELKRKNAEIHAFSQVLQRRVDEATRELQAAQGRLVQSARLAAVGEMGAGLAHELNNPVAGILGLTQVLIARAGEGSAAALLRSIEEQALRCKQIVSHLLGFSREMSSSSVDPVEPDVVDLDLLLADLRSLMGAALRQRGIVVNVEGESGLATRGDRAELGRAFAQLLTSLRGAVGEGAQIDIRAERDDACVAVILRVSGQPIEIGGDDWKAAGLGFWAASRVFADAGGSLVEPELKAGQIVHSAVWRVRLPEA